MIGRILSHYRIVEKIGSGGMGVVYKAHDEHLGRDVAIKVLPLGTLADDRARKRFRKEAEALSTLNHPNIATVHDFDTQERVDFIVMELVDDYLENAFAERTCALAFVKVEPLWDPIRSDPRFQDLLRRMNFPE